MNPHTSAMMVYIEIKHLPIVMPNQIIIVYKCNAIAIGHGEITLYTRARMFNIRSNVIRCWLRDNLNTLQTRHNMSTALVEHIMTDLYNNFGDAQLYVNGFIDHRDIFALLD